MARVQRTSEARHDLAAIWLYVARDNQPAADRFIEKIENTLNLLARFPFVGEAVDHLRPGVRRFTAGNYQLFYKPVADGILLMRVYHAARTIEDLFG